MSEAEIVIVHRHRPLGRRQALDDVQRPGVSSLARTSGCRRSPASPRQAAQEAIGLDVLQVRFDPLQGATLVAGRYRRPPALRRVPPATSQYKDSGSHVDRDDVPDELRGRVRDPPLARAQPPGRDVEAALVHPGPPCVLASAGARRARRRAAALCALVSAAFAATLLVATTGVAQSARRCPDRGAYDPLHRASTSISERRLRAGAQTRARGSFYGLRVALGMIPFVPAPGQHPFSPLDAAAGRRAAATCVCPVRISGGERALRRRRATSRRTCSTSRS
mgnify:CR=1 FL=1